MHSLLIVCSFMSFAFARPVYVNDDIYQVHEDDNTILTDKDITGGYVYGKHEIASGNIHEGHEQAPIVERHVYVHIAPPENDYAPPQKVIPPPPPKIHYKIVFIKVPSPPTQAAPVLPAPQQDQEKTLIYVLHKHPSETPPVVIPTPKPTAPAKPEVYFIRYKANKHLVPTQGPGTYDYTSTQEPHHTRKTHIREHLRSTAVSVIPHSNASNSYN